MGKGRRKGQGHRGAMGEVGGLPKNRGSRAPPILSPKSYQKGGREKKREVGGGEVGLVPGI